MTIGRRGFIAGLGALFAAPAIVQVSSLMPVRGVPLYGGRNNLLTIDMITREAVQMFKDSNAFFQNIERYDAVSEHIETRLDVLYGSMKIRPEWGEMTVRLPNDYVVTGVETQNSFRVLNDAPLLARGEIQRSLGLVPELPASAALALGVAAVVEKNPVVSRRFWGGG